MTITNQRFENLDATPPPRFTPSPLRGHALLDAVLTHISSLPREGSDGKETWNQGTWMTLDTEAVQELFDARSDAITPVDPTDVGGRGFKLSPEVAITECGTAACFAGHTGLMVGDSPLIRIEHVTASWAEDGTEIKETLVRDDWGRLVDADGRVHEVRERARELLGLDYCQAECLFNASNTIHDLKAIIGWIKEGIDGLGVVERYRDEISDRI